MDGQTTSAKRKFPPSEEQQQLRDEVVRVVNKEALPTTPAQVEPAETHRSIDFQQILSRILHFLSTASNETLGATCAGLAAVTYFILGRLGLVLIGIVGGVILHATWEGNGATRHDAQDEIVEIARRREASLDIVQRLLDWRKRKDAYDLVEDEDAAKENSKSGSPDFSSFQPAVRAALTDLTDAVIRDYVKWWYVPILPDDGSFPSACRQTFATFLLSISSHLSRKRPADAFLEFVTNSSSVIVVFLNELSNALMNSSYSDIESSDALHQYLESNPASSLANVLDPGQQKAKLANVANDILQIFLDQKAYRCEPVKSFLQQILAGVCLEMTVQSCSKPEWLNGWIVYLLEEGEPELLNALDAGVGGATVIDIKATAAQSNLNQVATNIEAAASGSSVEKQSKEEHKRTVSRAEEAMDEAMQEARRLSELIAAEEAKKARSEDNPSSGTTTEGGPTPTSSQSDLGGFANGSSGPADDILRDLQPLPNVDPEPVSSFTNFDQLVNSRPPTALHPDHAREHPIIPPLTLHNASISIFDDSVPGERGTIRSKPTVDYLLQVEPATSQHPGWMIARKYADFETLHEVLRRISKVSGVPEFADTHGIIPGWKNRSKDALRTDLERYLRDALTFNRLAESEGMKRFLEKDQGLGRSSPTAKQGGFTFPTPAAFETMGKGMLDVLSAAPKGAAGGGKAILGGVTGVLGGVGSLGQKKQVPMGSIKSAQSSHAKLTRTDSITSVGRASQEIPRKSFNEPNETRAPPLPAKLDEMQPSRSPVNSLVEPYSTSKVSHGEALSNTQLETSSGHELHLPPPPSEIPDDWSSVPEFSRKSTSNDGYPRPPSEDYVTLRSSVSRKTNSPLRGSDSSTAPPTLPTRAKPPITEEETRVAVELFFAVVNELYTLSSAWNFRRTLLNAAKNYLLRPGNPSLEAIRMLIQETMIDANTSDTGLATHLLRLRENTMPTEEERRTWPPPRSEGEKMTLRRKARKLLVEKGMPQALTSVMGSAASGEALGRVFDALQVEEIARGLMFALILQGVKAVTQ